MKDIEKKECVDFGLVLTLVFTLAGLRFGERIFFLLSAAASIVSLTIPLAYTPAAFAWRALSRLLGSVSSKVMLTIVFFFLVVPIAAVRRLFGADSLQLRKFKKSNDSVFTLRNHHYSKEDLSNPY